MHHCPHQYLVQILQIEQKSVNTATIHNYMHPVSVLTLPVKQKTLCIVVSLLPNEMISEHTHI